MTELDANPDAEAVFQAAAVCKLGTVPKNEAHRMLVSLPDVKNAPLRLTVGNRYLIRRPFGTNGVVVLQDDGIDEIALLASRFEEA